jgi:hypothetical protein
MLLSKHYISPIVRATALYCITRNDKNKRAWSLRGLYETYVAITVIFYSPLIAFILLDKVAYGF